MKTNPDLIEIKSILEKPQKISIVIHKNPDGDAMGSGLALKKFLEKKGHEVWLISPNTLPDYLKWLPGSKQILIFDKDKKKVKQALEQSQIIFTLDFNDLSRTGEDLENILNNLKNKIFVMIDHHLHPKNYAQFTFSDSNKSSTSEMIYDFISALNGAHAIDKDMATNLYTGIMTDTGSFKFPATTPHTMKVAGELMKKGAEHNQIQIKIYDSFTQDKLGLLGEALKRLHFLPEYKTAYIVLDQNALKKYHYKKGDTEGFVNYGLALKDAIFAVLFTENEDGSVRISFRSKNHFPANEFAQKYFNGGGHLNAAGGRTKMNIEEAEKYFLKVLPKFYREYQMKNSKIYD